jgi:hypothetical protein
VVRLAVLGLVVNVFHNGGNPDGVEAHALDVV